MANGTWRSAHHVASAPPACASWIVGNFANISKNSRR
jgi:hypothetical protein